MGWLRLWMRLLNPPSLYQVLKNPPSPYYQVLKEYVKPFCKYFQQVGSGQPGWGLVQRKPPNGLGAHHKCGRFKDTWQLFILLIHFVWNSDFNSFTLFAQVDPAAIQRSACRSFWLPFTGPQFRFSESSISFCSSTFLLIITYNQIELEYYCRASSNMGRGGISGFMTFLVWPMTMLAWHAVLVTSFATRSGRRHGGNGVMDFYDLPLFPHFCLWACCKSWWGGGRTFHWIFAEQRWGGAPRPAGGQMSRSSGRGSRPALLCPGVAGQEAGENCASSGQPRTGHWAQLFLEWRELVAQKTKNCVSKAFQMSKHWGQNLDHCTNKWQKKYYN